MMTRRIKDMFGLYQNVVAAVLSAFVSGSDTSVNCEEKSQVNMCVENSLEQKIEQCRVDDAFLINDTAGNRKKKKYAALQRMLSSQSMIVEQEVLEAVIHVESKGNVEIGSRGNGCGVMQLTLPAIAGGLSRLYSPTMRHDQFRERYAGALDAKRAVIDQVTDNYFARLEDGARRASERVKDIRKEYSDLKDQKRWFKADKELVGEVTRQMNKLQQERKVLGQFVSAVKHGYILFDPGARKVYDARMESLRKVKDADRLITRATGVELAWVNYVGKERQMISEMRRRVCEVENTELNVAFGDLTLTMEGEYFNLKRGKKEGQVNALQQALFSYNQGRTAYLTNGAWQRGEYYRRFSVAYYNLFDDKPPREVPLRESRLMM